MKNLNRNRNGALPDRRCLRFEPLESRLPFAVDVTSFDVDSWLMPVTENSLFFDEQWIGSPLTTRNYLEAAVPINALLAEEAYSIADLLDATSFYRHAPEDYIAILAQPVAVIGRTTPLVEDNFSTDLGLSDDALLSNSGNLAPVNLSIEQIDDVMFSQDWWIPDIIPLSVRSPFHSDALEGLAIPLGDFLLSNLDGDAGDVQSTTVAAADSGERVVFRQLPRFEHGVLVSAHSSSMKLDGNLLGDAAAFYSLTHLKLQSAPQQSHGEKSGKFAEQASSFLSQGFSHPNHAVRFPQHYQTLAEMLQRNGIELATEYQLSIDREQVETPTSSRSQEIDDLSRIEITQSNAKLPFHTLPEGMLAIGSEVGVKDYRRVQNFKLNEDFIAQTALICDDLQAVVAPYADPIVPLEESPFLSAPERFRWVAIGSTIIITHASLLARKSREASITKWFVVQLAKFKKHAPT